MVRIEGIVGSLDDSAIEHAVHDLDHEGRVEVVRVSQTDLERRRLLAQTDKGEEVAICLPRDQKLFDGAVLYLEPGRAIIVRAEAERWLRASPATAEDALSLGYCAGNLHWRVRFDGSALLIALHGPVESYLARIQALIDEGRIAVVEEDA